MTTLYKKDNTKKIRTWSIDVEGDELVMSYGYLNGVQTTKYTQVRTNRSGRTIDEQIDLEYNSRINKQLDCGYVEDLDKADSRTMANSLNLPLPMLAQPIDKIKRTPPSLYCQYKYDGMRCLIHNGPDGNVAYSRGGKRIETVRHITDSIVIPPGMTVDGELYLHDASLQTIVSLAKRYQPATRNLNYMLYDAVINEGYSRRYKAIRHIASESGASIKLAPLTKLGMNSISVLLNEAQLMGYEGLILRDPNTPYETGKRSVSLIKVKSVDDDQFPILEIKASKDGHARLVCGNFTVLCPGDHEFKRSVLANAHRYIGKDVRVEFANRTKDGVPFHPVATCIVDD